jgi:hypothetical protein
MRYASNIQNMRYFSEMCFRALEIADALSETTAANFFGPIAVKTRSISSSRVLAV